MKILLAVDGSRYTQRMLAYLAGHEEMFARSIHYTAITVVPKLPPNVARHLDAATVESYYAEQAATVLSPVETFGKEKGWVMEMRHAIGHAPDVIAEHAAATRYDLIVMGSRGHAALKSLVLGSVTMRLLAQSSTPVLIVPE